VTGDRHDPVARRDADALGRRRGDDGAHNRLLILECRNFGTWALRWR
jgi:hypothetical protein